MKPARAAFAFTLAELLAIIAEPVKHATLKGRNHHES
jgi:hypothetical protein